ncbi:hypothetical protein ACHAPG_009969 [Botrytis cinerea]
MSGSYPKDFIRIHEYVRKRGTLLQPASQQPRPSNKSYTLPKSKNDNSTAVQVGEFSPIIPDHKDRSQVKEMLKTLRGARAFMRQWHEVEVGVFFRQDA